MRSIVVLAFAATATACASTQGAYQAPVRETAYSAKSVDEVSRCLQLAFGSAPITLDGGELAFPQRNNFGSTLGLISVRREGGRTVIEQRWRAPVQLSADGWKRCV